MAGNNELRLQDTEHHRRGVWRSFSNETNWRQSCIKYFSAQCNRAKSNETDTVGDIEPIKAFRQSWHFARNYAILRSWEQHGADRLVAPISIAVEQGCTLPSGFGMLYYGQQWNLETEWFSNWLWNWQVEAMSDSMEINKQIYQRVRTVSSIKMALE
ncbi:hypothetical protein J6590_043181 [Homalodisca vitripennis]|nr:hypothetical protein J6590_043181 [Homalodisca vitripennis]